MGLRPTNEPLERPPPNDDSADSEGPPRFPRDGDLNSRSARLEVHLTVPPGTDEGAACRVLVHALARLAVSRALAEEEPHAGGGLRALLNNAPGR